MFTLVLIDNLLNLITYPREEEFIISNTAIKVSQGMGTKNFHFISPVKMNLKSENSDVIIFFFYCYDLKKNKQH